MASRDFEVAFRLGAQLTNEFRNTFSSANNAIKSLAGAAAAVGGLVGLGSVVAQVSEMTDAMNKLTAATGVSGQEMQELQDVAKNVFRDNYGESFTDVTEALAKVKQNIQGLNTGELEQIAKDALMLADTFDGDVNEVTRATNNMMKNFGIESTKAMDLFAAGGQRGLNFSGEMFDNISEYAPLFSTMGYSAEEYFGILQRGAQAGVYNLDYVNDVMKEFQIRTKDGSKATSEAMGMLSKDAQNVWKEFLKGNGTVSDVASTVVGELKGMEDQILAGQLAVSLFGTKFEDLEADAVYAMLGTSEAMKDFEGSMAAINEIRFDSVGKAIQGIGRILLVDLIMPIADMALPPLNALANFLSDNLPGAIDTTKSTLKTITPILAGLTAAALTYRTALFLLSAKQIAFNTIQAITPKLLYAHRTALLAYTFAGGGVRGVIVAMRSAMAALNITLLANPFVLAAAAIVGIGVAFYTAYKMSDKFRAAVDNALVAIKSFIVNSANYISSNASLMWDKFLDGAKEMKVRLLETMGSLANDAMNFFGAGLTGKIGTVIGNFVDSFKAGLSSLPGVLSMLAPMMTTLSLGFLGVSGPVGLLVGGIVSVIGYLYRLSKTNDDVAAGLGNAWAAVKTAFAPILEVFQQGISDFATNVGPQLTQTMAVISESIAELGPSFAEVGATLAELGGLLFTQWATTVSTIATTVLPLLLQVFQTVFPLILSLLMTVIPTIAQIITSVVPIFLQLAQLVIPLILSVVQMVFPMILTIIQSVLPIVATLLTIVANVILTLAQTVLPLVLSVVQMVFPILLSVIQAVIPIVVVILQTLVAIINGVLVPAINAILSVVQVVFPYIQMIIQNALAIVNGIIQTAMALLRGDWDGAWNAIKGTAETIMNNIISFFQGIDLFEVGKSIITGLIDGIKSMGSTVVGAISNMIPEPIRGAASKLLGALPGFATGGVVSAPTLAWVGEGGDTESIIPWNNSQRSKDLWMQTGHAIGALGELNTAGQGAPDWSVPAGGDTFNKSTTNNGGAIIHLSNYTTIHAKGGDAKEIEDGVNKGNESALEMLRRWQHDERRVSFD